MGGWAHGRVAVPFLQPSFAPGPPGPEKRPQTSGWGEELYPHVRNLDPHSGLLLPSKKLATTLGNTSNVPLEFSFLLCVGSLIYSRIWQLQHAPGTSIRNSEMASRPLFSFSIRKWLQCRAELRRANPTKAVCEGCRGQWHGVASHAGALWLLMERQWLGQTEPWQEVRALWRSSWVAAHCAEHFQAVFLHSFHDFLDEASEFQACPSGASWF